MLIESAGPRIRLLQPRSFTGLMTLYAANHASLRQLLGDLRTLPHTLASNSPTDLQIIFTVCERSRYTTSVRMTYWLSVAGRGCPEPDLDVRIYHDARLVEAVSCRDQPKPVGLHAHAVPHRAELLRRWALNVLLRKWLEHCLDHKHRFERSEVRFAGPV